MTHALYLNCALIISAMNMVLIFSQPERYRTNVPGKLLITDSLLFPNLV